MGTQGCFGFIIGNKKYFMHVQYDAYALWDILLKDFYILLKHFSSIDAIQSAFESIIIIENDETPDLKAIEKCKYFTNLEVSYKTTKDWHCLLYACQKSFIYLLEAGYMVNTGHLNGYVIALDFNQKALVDLTEYTELPSHPTIIYVDQVLAMENPPSKTYLEIVSTLHKEYKYCTEIKSLLNKQLSLAKEMLLLNEQIKCLEDEKNLPKDEFDFVKHINDDIKHNINGITNKYFNHIRKYMWE